MIEFSCHTWTFNDLTLAEAFGTMARLGFRYVDVGLAINKAAVDPLRTAAEISDDLAYYHLKVSDLYLMLPRISLADEARRARDVETFKALLPLALLIRTPGITLSPGLISEEADAFERAAEALRTMVAAAQAAGLRVSIEPHANSLAETPAAARKLIDAVPGLAITLDWAQMVYQNAKPEAIRELLAQTRHVHIRQASPKHLQTPFDKGKIDFAGVMGDLQAAGYEGAVCVEIVNTAGRYGISTVNAVQESARIRDALREARDQS